MQQFRQRLDKHRGRRNVFSSGVSFLAAPYTTTLCPAGNVRWTSVRGQLSVGAKTLQQRGLRALHPNTVILFRAHRTERDKP
ncbi:hypothetical protein NCCP2716_18870 [Sporosarcina sp. NCCP-2716]|nr:hypothetical protein NCCP2716_18870 [Sporosarcina sp. NCCP-2716]